MSGFLLKVMKKIGKAMDNIFNKSQVEIIEYETMIN